jgi:hypothetical protein
VAVALSVDDTAGQLGREAQEEWVDRLMEKLEAGIEAEMRHRERAGYWRAVADMQEGRPLRP